MGHSASVRGAIRTTPGGLANVWVQPVFHLGTIYQVFEVLSPYPRIDGRHSVTACLNNQILPPTFSSRSARFHRRARSDARSSAPCRRNHPVPPRRPGNGGPLAGPGNRRRTAGRHDVIADRGDGLRFFDPPGAQAPALHHDQVAHAGGSGFGHGSARGSYSRTGSRAGFVPQR